MDMSTPAVPADALAHPVDAARRSARARTASGAGGSTLRIAFLLDQFPKVSETFILDQVTALIDRGHDVRVHAKGRDASGVLHPDVVRYRLMERTVHRKPRATGPFARLATARSLLRIGARRPASAVRLVRSRDPADGSRAELVRTAEMFTPGPPFECIHAHFGPMGRIAQELRAAGLVRAPLITSFHGYDVNVLPARFPADWYAQLFRNGDLFTANSEFLRGRLVALGCPADRTVVLPMGVDLSRFPFGVRVPPDGPVRLLSVGRLVDVKGIDYALRAIAIAKDRGLRVRYTVVGDGERRGELQHLARTLDIAGMVDFAGWRTHDEVRALYASHHVFVQPSVTARDGAQEAQGVALLEAQATGMPVIATRTGGVPESVPDPDDRLVPERDEEALAARLMNVCGMPESWEALGRAGRSHVERHFERETLIDRLVELYRTVIAQATRPR